ncbi:MAG TPA: TlpA disulfide reductase family protein [Pyrinomonadaceae bacterium]|nr:TlpA disulfide reductase family protein [Pyrinomonadaceae bacterium]
MNVTETWRRSLAASVLLAAAVLAPGCTSDDAARDANSKAGANANSGGKPTVTVTQQRGAPPAAAQPANPGASVPLSDQALNAEIQPLDGAPFRLSDFRDKVVVLDIWATWCGPCRFEIPHLVDISKEFAPKGVEVIGLTLENPQTDEEKVRDFAREYKINYKLGWARADVAQELMAGRGNIPQTFIIKDGKIVKRFIGFSPDKSPPMLLAAIEEATGMTSGD